MASLRTTRWLNELPEDTWETFVPRVAAVTVEDVQRAARTVVRPEEGVLVVVGEASALEPVCARYGEVAVVDSERRPPD
jgi:predicted Zn-dependent peptidase